MTPTRREFLQAVGCGALGAAAFVAGVERFFMVNALAAAEQTDYKALVCVFLFGGNDANNMVVPVDDYASYMSFRGDLTIPEGELLPIKPAGDSRQFGLHPKLVRLHALWGAGNVAVIVNVGPLIEPLTKKDYQTPGSRRPYQLFSHSDQQAEWQTAYANGQAPTGWGGRIADLGLNPGSTLPTIASVAGVTVFSTGSSTSPLVVAPAPTALNQALKFKRSGDGDAGSTLQSLLALASGEGAPLLVREVADVGTQAIQGSLALSQDPPLNTQFPTTGLGNQLKQVAKLIALSRTAGVRRQIFFASLGGFDTHTNQGSDTGQQATLLQTVSDATGALYDATVELGVATQVTTFTMSDFSRTFKPAGTGPTTGSDHAWGSHHFVMGGAVRGGGFYGQFPMLQPNGPDDTDSGTGARGRWIPTTSVDQYASTLALWFGVPPASLPAVLPNIGHFASANLGFLG